MKKTNERTTGEEKEADSSLAVNKRIKTVMEQKRLRACVVEDRARMKRGVISRIIAGKRKVYAEEVLPICYALGVSVECLFNETGGRERIGA